MHMENKNGLHKEYHINGSLLAKIHFENGLKKWS